ncbi:MAG: Glu/Leu/Phe/Val dehydrogenase dimerization domain-containing protein [Actinomycetes bacterium]
MSLHVPQGGSNPWTGFDGHEEVVLSQHDGVWIVIVLHSTRLGPALGGTRMADYAESADPGAAAYADALRLSKAMTYKNALAGLDHGGGKAVIVADPDHKPLDLLQAYGQLVESLGGRYVTAGDVGMTVDDMDVIGDVCRWTTGRSPAKGGVGDSGILTAFGVFQGMRAGAETVWGSPDLAGRRVGVVGAGKVGGRLIGHLTEAGAEVITVDRGAAAREAVLAAHPEVQFLESSAALVAEPLDILSPNALGGFLTADLVPQITARLVCGGANNQLATPEVADLLASRGIVYAPDFMVNCGGVIQVAEELVGCDLDRARERTARVYETTLRVLDRARSEGVTPVVAAEQEAEERIARGPSV